MVPIRATISCRDDGWGFELFHHLREGREVDLSDIDLLIHEHFCRGLAEECSMAVYYDPNRKKMRFFNAGQHNLSNAGRN
jgi:hypothetical protein